MTDSLAKRLKVVEVMTRKEVAEALGITVTSVEKTEKRALAKVVPALRALLWGDGDGAGTG